MNRLPAWFKQSILDDEASEKLRLLSAFKVNTVCVSAKCPNLTDCFKNAQLTFMILGNVCTRDCLFCAVPKDFGTALSVDKDEPYRIAGLVKKLGIKYVVITSVTRDDLPDGGASHYAETIKVIRQENSGIDIEVLVPDFFGNTSSVAVVVEAMPSVFAHNIETVGRLHKELKPKSSYAASLAVLKNAKSGNTSLVTKSSILLGLGESEDEIVEAMRDLRGVECDILALGQYLAPSKDHYPVREFISIGEFIKLGDIARGLGFKVVLSGPKVRSSYKAEQVYREVAYV